MSDYCEQMMKCRKDPTEFEKLDLIYQPAHLLALFAIFDKAERKYITMEQYRNGKSSLNFTIGSSNTKIIISNGWLLAMEMLGVSRYNPQPIGFEENMVTEDVFFDESYDIEPVLPSNSIFVISFFLFRTKALDLLTKTFLE